MIQKKIIGRLGNQFFQYATIRAYMIRFNIEDEIGFNFDLVGDGKNGYGDSLNLYNIKNYKVIKNLNYKFFQKIIILFIKSIEKIINLFFYKNKREYYIYIFENYIQKFINKYGVFWVMNGYVELSECKYNKDNLIFHGFFESSKYFDNIKGILIKEFTPKEKISKDAQELLQKLIKGNYTCISIRRGDFVSNEKFKKIHFICDEEYFYKAMSVAENNNINLKYFVCSDDIEWVKSNIKFPEKSLFETGNSTLSEKIVLMSNCKNYIISNSTFSWWTQYLSNNENKIVIAPKIWRNFDYTLNTRHNDILQDEWILI